MNLAQRADIHAALSDPARLAIVDELTRSDRTPAELAALVGQPSNLLAHHLGRLEQAGLIERVESRADRRRKYVQLRVSALVGLTQQITPPSGRIVFVCTHNSARSQLAAALWKQTFGGDVDSAGTDPAPTVHPRAVGAAERAGIRFGSARPQSLDEIEPGDVYITVCDNANETSTIAAEHLHWSIPDPAAIDTDEAFDEAVLSIRKRIDTAYQKTTYPGAQHD